MDLYVESISAHPFTATNKMICILASVFGAMLSVGAFLFFDWYTIFIVGILVFLVYRIICSQNYEYEYILDASSLCVFKIVNKSSRKKLLEIPVEKMIALSVYHEAPGDGYVIHANGTEENAMVLSVSDTKRTKLIFCPNEKMTDALQKILKRY